jgi:hypothetical protein
MKSLIGSIFTLLNNAVFKSNTIIKIGILTEVGLCTQFVEDLPQISVYFEVKTLGIIFL